MRLHTRQLSKGQNLLGLQQFPWSQSVTSWGDQKSVVSVVSCRFPNWFCPISPNPISPKPNSPNPDPNPIPNPIPNPKHTVTLKLTVNIRRNGIRRNGRTPPNSMDRPAWPRHISYTGMFPSPMERSISRLL